MPNWRAATWTVRSGEAPARLVEVANEAEARTGSVAADRKIEDGKRSGEWLVLGHDSRLGQVIINLIDNARSFSEPGGDVRVSLRRARGAAAEGQPPRGGFEIMVDDDGPGIPAHALERIFERFYTDRPTQSFGQNSGLGLSISRQIVEAHGGAISRPTGSTPKTHVRARGSWFSCRRRSETNIGGGRTNPIVQSFAVSVRPWCWAKAAS